MEREEEAITISFVVAGSTVSFRDVDHIMNLPGARMGTSPAKREKVWALDAPASRADDVDGAICDLLTRLQTRRDSLEEVLQQAPGARAWLSIGLKSNRAFAGTGIVLTSVVLRKLVDLRIDVDFDVYCTAPHQ